MVSAKAFQISSYEELHKISNLLYLNFATGAASDLSVTLASSWLLVKSRTGFRRTDTIINTLMLYTVNTGLIVSIDAALSLITYVAMPDNFVFLGFYLLLSKLYLNSYLAMLNARDDLREKFNNSASRHISNISILEGKSDGSATIQPSFSKQDCRSQLMAISVTTFVENNEGGPYTPPASPTTVGRAV